MQNPGQKQERKSSEARKALDGLKKSAEKKKRMGLVEESFVSIDSFCHYIHSASQYIYAHFIAFINHSGLCFHLVHNVQIRQ